MTTEPTDEDLIRAAAGGDRDAFQALFGRYERPILNFAWRYGGDYQEAEEVVQETFLRLFKHGAKFDPSRPARAWIYAIASNVARSRGARGSRRPRPTPEAVLAGTADDGRSPVSLAAAAEEAEAVRRAVARLPEEQRLVFVLARYQGLGYAEVAEIVGVPVGTVKSRMFRAIRFCREELEGLLP